MFLKYNLHNVWQKENTADHNRIFTFRIHSLHVRHLAMTNHFVIRLAFRRKLGVAIAPLFDDRLPCRPVVKL